MGGRFLSNNLKNNFKIVHFLFGSWVFLIIFVVIKWGRFAEYAILSQANKINDDSNN